jgi:hypothetical protein
VFLFYRDEALDFSNSGDISEKKHWLNARG